MSLFIGMSNILFLILSVLLLWLPFDRKTDWMVIVLFFSSAYCLLSCIPTAIGTITGIIECFKRKEKTQAVIGLLLNAIYLLVFYPMVVVMWVTWAEQ